MFLPCPFKNKEKINDFLVVQTFIENLQHSKNYIEKESDFYLEFKGPQLA